MSATPKKPDPVDSFVGHRVKLARVMANMSQSDLADVLGITFQQVHKYEKGVNRIGSGRLHQIAAALGQPIAWFFDQAPEKPGGAATSRDLVERVLLLPGGVALNEAYAAIAGPKVRHLIVELVKAIAEQSGAHTADKKAA